LVGKQHWQKANKHYNIPKKLPPPPKQKTKKNNTTNPTKHDVMVNTAKVEVTPIFGGTDCIFKIIPSDMIQS
jgi:hypothetical protein